MAHGSENVEREVSLWVDAFLAAVVAEGKFRDGDGGVVDEHFHPRLRGDAYFTTQRGRP